MRLRGRQKSARSALNASDLENIYRQRSRTWLGIYLNSWLIISHQKWGSHPTWGRRKILNRKEKIILYQKTRNSLLLFPRTFSTIREQLSTLWHPQIMFIRILPPHDTPHYCSHAHQMAFKTHPDRENRPRYCIPMCPLKHTDSGNMHYNCGKTSLSLSASDIWHHTRTGRIYHHQWGRNRP